MGGSRILFAAALMALLLPALSPAVAAGPEPPSLLATAYNTQRKLARSADAVYAVVTVNASGTPQVRVVVTTDGATWTALPPPSTTGLASDRASLAIDSRGRLHLVWTELLVERGQVFYARFGSGSWTLPEQISHSPGYAGFPSLAVDATDRPHVAWYGFDGSFYQIYYRRLDFTGWTPERALTNEVVDATNPAVALGPEGHVHVAWFRQDRTARYNEVAYLRVEGDTVAETRALSVSGVDSIDPSLAVDDGRNAHVVWSALVGGVERIQHIEQTRSGSWSDIVTISPPGFGARHPSLAADRGPLRFLLVWEGADGPIYMQSGDGIQWSSPAALSAGGINRYPSVRWAQYHNPSCRDLPVDVLWTQEADGTSRLAHRTLESPMPCGDGSEAFAVWPLLAFAVTSGVLGIAAYLVWLRRRWYPKPPR